MCRARTCECVNFRESTSARKRFLAATRHRVTGGEARGIPSLVMIADDNAAGGRLLSSNFFEGDSRSMFHELLRARRKGLRPPRMPRKSRSPRSTRLPRLPLSQGKTENLAEFSETSRCSISKCLCESWEEKKIYRRGQMKSFYSTVISMMPSLFLINTYIAIILLRKDL